MDLDNINCPQFVDFYYLDSLNNVSDTSTIERMSLSPNPSQEAGLSQIEGDIPEDDTNLSEVSSEEYFEVHTRVTRSATAKQKKYVTVPQPFQFETDNRLKNKPSLHVPDDQKDFTSQLRQHKAPQPMATGITKVKPFKLTKAKTQRTGEEYLTMAEQIKAFQNKTPERYHGSSQKEFQPQKHWTPPKVIPKTPKLQAVKRHRPVEALSREELEAKEIEEMKAYKFHAQPVDPRVYKPNCIEKTEAHPAKRKKSIESKTAQKTVKKHTRQKSEKTYEFRARPVPKNILAGPTGLGEKLETTVTIPKSPSFITEKRLLKRKLLEQETKDSPAKKQKIVKSKQPVFPSPLKVKYTEVKPFSFDAIDKERYALREKKIQAEIEKENKPYIFKAQQMPASPRASALPNIKKKPVTQPRPFNFCYENKNITNISTSVETVSFKAQPATVLQKKPFIPEKPFKQGIEIQEFELHTDRRASERLLLKEQKEIEEQEKEKLLLARKALEEEQERQEIEKLRQELVHKANPVRQFKPIEIKRSTKPLTQPISPDFATSKRFLSKIEQ